MKITYETARQEDIEPIYQCSKQLIDEYEDTEHIAYDKVLTWVHRKIEHAIDEYTVILVEGQKAGYYHFYKNEEGIYEMDDLYLFPEFQNRGIGTTVMKNCCASVDEPVMLYVFIKNQRAVSLYQKLGFQIIKTVNESRYIMQKDNRPYYKAYDERYKTAHAYGVSWASDISTPIVREVMEKYHIHRHHYLLEIGCGEGRDARTVLEDGYALLATDSSPEAIAYCQRQMPQYEHHFRVLDCLSDTLDTTFDFIFSIAVIHMLVPDRDRDGFYQFICHHLKAEGCALICTMGNGEWETQSDIATAFSVQERNHASGKMMVAGTSCRMVSFQTWKNEMARNGLAIVETGMTTAFPDFDNLMYAVVRKG